MEVDDHRCFSLWETFQNRSHPLKRATSRWPGASTQHPGGRWSSPSEQSAQSPGHAEGGAQNSSMVSVNQHSAGPENRRRKSHQFSYSLGLYSSHGSRVRRTLTATVSKIKPEAFVGSLTCSNNLAASTYRFSAKALLKSSIVLWNYKHNREWVTTSVTNTLIGQKIKTF